MIDLFASLDNRPLVNVYRPHTALPKEPTKEELAEASDNGQFAYIDGIPLSLNPYNRNYRHRSLAQAWDKGWTVEAKRRRN